MNERMYRSVNEWMIGCIDLWINDHEWMYRSVNERMKGWINECIDLMADVWFRLVSRFLSISQNFSRLVFIDPLSYTHLQTSNTRESKKHEIYKSIQIQGNPRNMKFTNPSKYRGIQETWNLQIHPNTGESKKHETYKSIQIQGEFKKHETYKSV